MKLKQKVAIQRIFYTEILNSGIKIKSHRNKNKNENYTGRFDFSS